MWPGFRRTYFRSDRPLEREAVLKGMVAESEKREKAGKLAEWERSCRLPALFICSKSRYNESKIPEGSRDCTGNLWDKRGGIRMFRVFAVIAWAVLLVLLLYLWADVREMAGLVKEMKKELLRSHLSVRAAESFPNFQEEQQKEAEQAAKKAEERRQLEKRAGSPLKPAEERVLEEVLTEFLG